MTIRINRQAPFAPARGVTQLMYVGDDAAVDLATGKQAKPIDKGDAAVAALATYTASRTKGTKRWLSIGIAAYFVGKILKDTGVIQDPE